MHAAVAVVTGAGRGIGQAIAASLSSAGSSVAVWDLDEDVASEAARVIGGGAIGVGVDVTERMSVDAAHAETVRRLGPVEILVNNAGIDVIGPFLESEEADWERIVAVNYLGTVRCCRVLVGPMVERGRGRVVNIASDAARVGSSGEAVYSGSKGAVVSFTKALAREVAVAEVTVNCVCPGPTDTALLDQVAAVSPKLYDGLTRAIPMRRIAEPSDIGPLVAFLASDSAAYMTGQTISVNGGLTMA